MQTVISAKTLDKVLQTIEQKEGLERCFNMYWTENLDSVSCSRSLFTAIPGEVEIEYIGGDYLPLKVHKVWRGHRWTTLVGYEQAETFGWLPFTIEELTK